MGIRPADVEITYANVLKRRDQVEILFPGISHQAITASKAGAYGVEHEFRMANRAMETPDPNQCIRSELEAIPIEEDAYVEQEFDLVSDGRIIGIRRTTVDRWEYLCQLSDSEMTTTLESHPPDSVFWRKGRLGDIAQVWHLKGMAYLTFNSFWRGHRMVPTIWRKDFWALMGFRLGRIPAAREVGFAWNGLKRRYKVSQGEEGHLCESPGCKVCQPESLLSIDGVHYWTKGDRSYTVLTCTVDGHSRRRKFSEMELGEDDLRAFWQSPAGIRVKAFHASYWDETTQWILWRGWDREICKGSQSTTLITHLCNEAECPDCR